MATNKYDQIYREDAAACGAPFAAFERFFAGWTGDGLRVLDLGCGQGRDALMIARLGHSVHGVDLSPVGVAQLAAVAAEEGLSVSTEVADLADYRPAGGFDVVLLDRVLHMFRDAAVRASVLEGAKAACRVGGHLLIADERRDLPAIEAACSPPEWETVLAEKGIRFFVRQRRADNGTPTD